MHELSCHVFLDAVSVERYCSMITYSVGERDGIRWRFKKLIYWMHTEALLTEGRVRSIIMRVVIKISLNTSLSLIHI